MIISSKIQTFEALSINELYAILQLRNEVFIVEQNCPYLDLDDSDQECHHISIYDNDVLVAYSRVFKPGDKYTEACISRVISRQAYRKLGLGKTIVQAAIDFIHSEWNFAPIKISAQLYLQKFYESFGFEVVSETYLEDNIPHIAMLKK